MRKVFLIAVLIVSIIILINVTSYLISNNSCCCSINHTKDIPSFKTVGGRIISYHEFKEFIASRKLEIYLPTCLPDKYSLSAIWARDKGDNLDFPLIILYSKNNVTDYKAREDTLIIEITPSSPAPLEQYIENGAKPIYNKNGSLLGVLFEKAYCPTCISQKTLPLAIVRINGLEYLISFRDPNTLIMIINSMKQLS
ncbi:MAG: hypothetical protein J7J82_03560 [Staphylothermus sp.]|nr:hypothetical protein [Staphylothermus sp.]